MKYALLLDKVLVHVTEEMPWTGTPEMKKEFKDGFKGEYNKVVDLRGRDMKSYEEANVMATNLTALTGEQWLPFDDGDYTSHQFGCCQPPKVGDDVSYGFNGDYYPCGKVTRVTPGFRIITSTGKMFNRRKLTSQWVMKGGTWSLVKGVHDERNPHF